MPWAPTTAMAALLLAGCGPSPSSGPSGESEPPRQSVGQPTAGFGMETPLPSPTARATPPGSTGSPDPALARQWHLANTGQTGGTPGVDLGLSAVPELGGGILVAIIDSSIQIGHPDLTDRFVSGGSFSYRAGGTDPSPPPGGAQFFPPITPRETGVGQADDAHGTAVAGIIGATSSNGRGGQGVAPGVRMVGFDAIVNPTEANIADALARVLRSGADVLNNSWGPVDPAQGGSRSLERSPSSFRAGLEALTSQGRNGFGTVVVFAAGNGGFDGDRSDYNMFTNDRRVLAIGAVDHTGSPIGFSEPGQNILVAGFSGNALGLPFELPLLTGTNDGIVTTDISGARGYAGGGLGGLLGPLGSDPDTTSLFDGTSAAAPMVSGVIARMLSANTRLSWRDVRWLLALTARMPANSAGLLSPSPMTAHGHHPQVGFGIVDGGRAVASARSFRGLGPEFTCDSGEQANGALIPDASTQGITLSIDIPAACAGLEIVESVELIVGSNHPRSGDLQVDIIAPSGSRSTPLVTHNCNGPCQTLATDFSLSVLRFMGEPAAGRWQVRVTDGMSGSSGNLNSLRLVLRGHRRGA